MILGLVNIQMLSVPATNSNRQYGSRKMIKGNKNKVLFILLSLLLTFGWFYWFQLRPTQIRHDCSWVKRHNDAIPAQEAKTKEQQIKEWGDRYNPNNPYMIPTDVPFRPAQPAKDWWKPASPQEYSFCLHDKGL